MPSCPTPRSPHPRRPPTGRSSSRPTSVNLGPHRLPHPGRLRPAPPSDGPSTTRRPRGHQRLRRGRRASAFYYEITGSGTAMVLATASAQPRHLVATVDPTRRPPHRRHLGTSGGSGNSSCAAATSVPAPARRDLAALLAAVCHRDGAPRRQVDGRVGGAGLRPRPPERVRSMGCRPRMAGGRGRRQTAFLLGDSPRTTGGARSSGPLRRRHPVLSNEFCAERATWPSLKPDLQLRG